MIQIQNIQKTDDTSVKAYTIPARIRSLSDLSNIFLIQHAGKSPPGCPRSSGSILRLYPDINRIVSKGKRFNNMEEIKYNKAKTNFIF